MAKLPAPPGRFWTYQSLAQVLECHPQTVARWVKRLNLRIFHPSQVTVRLPDSEAQKLFAVCVKYHNADFPVDHQ